MRLKHRTFPYPVVGNGDDVDAAFQAPVEVHRRDDSFDVDIQCMMSSRSLGKLIEKKQAAYGLHVECSKTLYRSLTPLRVRNERAKASICAHDISGSVELNVVIFAKVDIPKYRVADAHPDYGIKRFFVSQGDFLAIAEGHHFDADIRRDMLRSIDSIMSVRARDDDGSEMYADLNGDKIIVFLSKENFESYKSLKQDTMFPALATQAIVLPVLIDALQQVSTSSSEYEGLRWCNNLLLRLDDMGLSVDTNPVELAQQLLEMPLDRLLSAYRKKLDESEDVE